MALILNQRLLDDGPTLEVQLFQLEQIWSQLYREHLDLMSRFRLATTNDTKSGLIRYGCGRRNWGHSCRFKPGTLSPPLSIFVIEFGSIEGVHLAPVDLSFRRLDEITLRVSKALQQT